MIYGIPLDSLNSRVPIAVFSSPLPAKETCYSDLQPLLIKIALSSYPVYVLLNEAHMGHRPSSQSWRN